MTPKVHARKPKGQNPRPKRSIAVVTRSKRHLKVAAQEFLKHLRQVGKAFKLAATNFDANAEECGGK
jgi:hypothetical protein